MRNTITGIVIGIVVGVMVGTTVVAPGLESARHSPGSRPENDPRVTGAEALNLAPGTISPRLPTTARTALTTPAKRLRVISLYPAKTPILGAIALRLQTILPVASGGRLNVTVYDPGTLVNTPDTLDAVKSGTVDAVFAPPGQWAQNQPALELFSAVPFGPGANEYLAWFYQGGGRDLFDEIWKKSGLHGTLCGALAPLSSGWYRDPVRRVDDFNGLTIRAQGLGAMVLNKLGVTVKNLNVDEILFQFEQGQLDGVEYALPSIDAPLGFQKFARNYYFPGWRQPVTLFSLTINAQTWTNMSPAERTAIDTVCGDNVRYALALSDAQQFNALKELTLQGVQVRRWPGDILQVLRDTWKSVARELVTKDPGFAKVWDSQQKFHQDYAIWREINQLE